MKYEEQCLACVKRFVVETATLSGAGQPLHDVCDQILNDLCSSPHDVACEIMRCVQGETDVADPYWSIKQKEVEDARQVVHDLSGSFSETLEGALKLSAIGNATDHFVTKGYTDLVTFSFAIGCEGIEKKVLRGPRDVLILGDNCG